MISANERAVIRDLAKKLAELVGGLIEKPAGSPTLVPMSDKRPELNTAAKAAEDFADDSPQ